MCVLWLPLEPTGQDEGVAWVKGSHLWNKIFLRVLNKHPEKIPGIFFRMFNSSPNSVIKFLSNKSNFTEDLSIILKMPKLIFLREIF